MPFLGRKAWPVASLPDAAGHSNWTLGQAVRGRGRLRAFHALSYSAGHIKYDECATIRRVWSKKT